MRDEPPKSGRVREFAETMIGWRVWRLAQPTEQHAPLLSTFMASVWPAGEPMKACCGSGRTGLRHGIHAFTSRSQAETYFDEQSRGKMTPHVYGKVALWGRVIVHEHGYRAQFAYPQRLLVPRRYADARSDIVNHLRRAYGIEVEWQ
ncbi:MAG: hypothetical protein ABSB70_15345 [Candidatus Velthaea sp.]